MGFFCTFEITKKKIKGWLFYEEREMSNESVFEFLIQLSDEIYQGDLMALAI